MRSKTLLSLTEFCLWLGGDPWAFAGINRYPEDAPLSADVVVTSQYPHQRLARANDSTYAGSNSRSHVEKAIERGEALFARLAGRYPAPVNVLAESHKYPSAFKLRYGTVSALFKPNFALVSSFGVVVEELLEADFTVTKLVGMELADIFSIDAVSVPDDTAASEVHVYLTDTDGNYTGNPLRQHEIRPLRVSIDSSGGAGNWIANIEGEAYLFVKPELYEIDPSEAISHEESSYVSAVDIYLASVDSCQQGDYLVPAPCSSLPCPEPSSVAICWTEEEAGIYKPSPVTCSEGEMTRASLARHPASVTMNYLAGAERDGQLMDAEMVALVSQLALGFLPFDEEIYEDYPVTPLFTSQAKYYRELQTWEQGRDMVAPQVGVKYALAVPAHIQHLLAGLEPRRGFVQALGEIMDRDWFVQSHGSSHK